MKKKQIIILVSIIAAISVGTFACGKKDEVVEKTNAVAVQVYEIGAESIENTYLYSGTVKPFEEINVFSTVQGKVAEVYFDIGDKVNEGDVLFQMDTADLLNNKKIAQAAINSAQASVNSANTSLEFVNGASMQTQIENAKSGLVNAEIAYNQAKTNYDNTKALYDTGAVSQFAMYQTTDGLKQAETAYNQAKESYDLIANKMPAENKRKAQDGLNAALAAKGSAQAQLDIYNKTIADSAVKSPISGLVTACNVKEGELLSSQMVPFSVINTDKVTIDVSVSDKIINSLEVGEKVDILISSVSDQVIKGEILTINPAANAGGTYDVRVIIDNASGNIKSGMFGEVKFIKEKNTETIVVPRNTVLSDDNGDYVFVEEDGIAVKKPVTTGIDSGDTIEITSGIDMGEKVITKGQTFISDGDMVSVSLEKKGE